MKPSRADFFLDTNVLIYWISDHEEKRRVAADLVERGGVVSVQVLNEFISVCRRPKRNVPWHIVNLSLDAIHEFCRIIPFTLEDQTKARRLCEQHNVPIYDACIIASAVSAGCGQLMTEDFQNGRSFGSVTITNPFR